MKVDYFAGVSRVTVRGTQAAPETSLRRLGLAKVAPLIGRVVGDRYRIEALLGRGTTSIVCRASTLDGSAGVAVKVLSPVSSDLVDAAVSDRFRFEAQALAGVSHPNVVAVVDSGTTQDGLLYTVLELLRGETLGRRLATRGRLEPDEAVRIACETAEGLHALHEKGLLHRDVKPANVFIARRDDGVEVVKVMDLGLGRVLGPAAADDDPPPSNAGPRRRMHTREGLVLGTGPYMSPELIQGVELDPRSDVYALGVVTYRMLTGTLPFAGSDLPLLLSRHIHDPVEPLVERAPSAGLSAALDAVVLGALEKDRERRPTTARDFAADLRAALVSGDDARLRADLRSGDFAERLHAALEEEEGPKTRRRSARWITLAIVALALLFTVFALARHHRSHRSTRPAPSVALPDSPSPAAPPAVPVSSHDAAPWAVVVGSASVEPAPRHGRAAPRRAAKRERTFAPGDPAPDDFKVPRWRTQARAEP